MSDQTEIVDEAMYDAITSILDHFNKQRAIQILKFCIRYFEGKSS